jgi:glycosyltransferase involved in cell wall biosynthesis
MNQNPLVSVIIAVYNGENYLGEAIDSVLKQTYKNFELIVINDGSTDNTTGVIEKYQDDLRSYQQTNSGLPATLNRGISLSRGDWIAFLDADDLWLPEKLSFQVAIIVKDPDIDLVFGHIIQFISPELDEEIKDKIYCPPDPIPGFHKISMLADRRVFDQVGLFSDEYGIGDFVEWYLRASEFDLKVHVHPEVVSKRRLHTTHKTNRSPEKIKGYVRMLKASLDRRRTESG